MSIYELYYLLRDRNMISRRNFRLLPNVRLLKKMIAMSTVLLQPEMERYVIDELERTLEDFQSKPELEDLVPKRPNIDNATNYSNGTKIFIIEQLICRKIISFYNSDLVAYATTIGFFRQVSSLYWLPNNNDIDLILQLGDCATRENVQRWVHYRKPNSAGYL